MAAYARLARLPRPRLEPVPVAEWVRRVAALETRRPVTVCPGPDLTVRADGGQLDQLLINLVRNAVDATLEGGGAVELGWTAHNGRLEVWVQDDGPGDRKSTRLNSSHGYISYAVFCLKKKNAKTQHGETQRQHVVQLRTSDDT